MTTVRLEEVQSLSDRELLDLFRGTPAVTEWVAERHQRQLARRVELEAAGTDLAKRRASVLGPLVATRDDVERRLEEYVAEGVRLGEERRLAQLAIYSATSEYDAAARAIDVELRETAEGLGQ